MKLHVLMVPAVLLLLASGYSAPGTVAGENTELQGTWSLVSVEINGQALTMDKLKEARLVVKGVDYSFTLGDTHLELTHKVDTAKKPKTLDLTVTAGDMKGKTFPAIYELKGDMLTICRHLEPGKARPTEFKTAPDSGLMVIVWKRTGS